VNIFLLYIRDNCDPSYTSLLKLKRYDKTKYYINQEVFLSFISLAAWLYNNENCACHLVPRLPGWDFSWDLAVISIDHSYRRSIEAVNLCWLINKYIVLRDRSIDGTTDSRQLCSTPADVALWHQSCVKLPAPRLQWHFAVACRLISQKFKRRNVTNRWTFKCSLK